MLSHFEHFPYALVSQSREATTCTRTPRRGFKFLQFSRDMHTRLRTGTCSSASNFSVYSLSHHHHRAFETFSIHLWVIVVSTPWDGLNNFQIASIPTLFGGFSPNSSRQPHATSISHDDLRHRRLDTQIDAILPHARPFPEQSSCSLFFSTGCLEQMPCLVRLLICTSVPRKLSSDLGRPRTSSTKILRVLRSTANGIRRINLHFPPSFDVATKRPDHPLHRLDRPLDTSVARHCPCRAPSRIKFVNVVSLSDFTMFSRRSPRNDQTKNSSRLRSLATKKANVFPSFSSPMNM